MHQHTFFQKKGLDDFKNLVIKSQLKFLDVHCDFEILHNYIGLCFDCRCQFYVG